MPPLTRRELFRTALAAGAGAAVASTAAGLDPIARKPMPNARLKLSLAAYSFRQLLDIRKKAWTLFDFMDRAAEWGCEAVELTEYYWEKPVTPGYVSKLKRHAHLAGLTISGTPIGNTFTHAAGEARDKEIERVRNWIDVSADLGSPTIRIFAGNTPKGSTDEAARRNVVECLETICPHAEKRGVFLALENHGGVVATADGMLEILKQVKCPWVGVNMDTGNFHSADPYAELARIAPYTVVVQYKAAVSFNKKKEPSDLNKVLKILRDVNYHGYFALEYEEAEDPMVAVPRLLGEIRKAL
jgi:sugar phosphate isomerase/epimerase